MKKINVKTKTTLASLVLTLFFVSVSFSKTCINDSDLSNPNVNESLEERYYQVVFVKIKDNAKYGEYITKLTPIISKYGARAERVIQISSFFDSHKGEKMDQPHVINIVSYKSKKAFEQFEKDPEFSKLQSLRNQAIEISGINGSSKAKKFIDGEASNRVYMVEFVNYKKKKMYNKYLKKAKRLYSRHNHHTELTLQPDSYFGNLKEMPNLVNIMYYDNAASKENMQKDKNHKEVENSYAAAVSGLIWVEGKAMLF